MHKSAGTIVFHPTTFMTDSETCAIPSQTCNYPDIGETIHAWEAGEEGARWVTVVVAAKPVEKDGKVFEEVNFE